MRTTNLTLLKRWLEAHGELATEDLASLARIKFHTLKRIISGERTPNELEQNSICSATGINKNDLFPLCESVKVSA